jgi:probable rRNA maturation factor
MKLTLDLLNQHGYKSVPTKAQFRRWIKAALPTANKNYAITIRIVNHKEIQTLNKKFRHQNKPTNIISFPLAAPPKSKLNLLGDLAICAPLMKIEAKQQQKPLLHHWAHITIHGILHLLGYDHIKPKDAIKMEKHEAAILRRLKFQNPY